MNYDDIIVPSVTGALGAFVSWLVGKKKENVEIQTSEISNVQEAIKIWKEMAQELKEEVAELKEKVETLTTEVHTLRSENISLRSKLGLQNEDN
jgi:archaellum component FlaC